MAQPEPDADHHNECALQVLNGGSREWSDELRGNICLLKVLKSFSGRKVLQSTRRRAENDLKLIYNHEGEISPVVLDADNFFSIVKKSKDG